MTLTQLRYLVAIVDAGLNITLAARQVSATQPGLSKQLKQMEDELGLQLFHRRGKSLSGLSLVGAQVVDRARTILLEAANIQALAANAQDEAEGGLRIATTHTQARYVLPRPLAALAARRPTMTLHLAPCPEREALSRVEQDAADIAIVSGPERPPTTDLALPIYRWDLVGLAPPELRIAREPSLVALAATPLVTYESAFQPASSVALTFEAAGLKPRLACTARDSDLIKTYVRAGLGLGLLAEMAVTPEDADLRTVRVDGLFPTRTTWAVLRRDRILRNPVLDLLGELAPHLDRQALRRAFGAGSAERNWPEPPHWRELHTPRPAPRPRFEPVLHQTGT